MFGDEHQRNEFIVTHLGKLNFHMCRAHYPFYLQDDGNWMKKKAAKAGDGEREMKNNNITVLVNVSRAAYMSTLMPNAFQFILFEREKYFSTENLTIVDSVGSRIRA